jgi:murein DD-endopeptidase MepM/ murein hydrolase activator NlpD
MSPAPHDARALTTERVMGIETEFGVLHADPEERSRAGAGSSILLSHLVVGSYALLDPAEGERGRRVRWDYGDETPLRDARGFELQRAAAHPTQLTDEVRDAHVPSVELDAPVTGPEVAPEGDDADVLAWASPRSIGNAVLRNGARWYVDHAHPEYSAPEVTRAREAVVADRAGEEIARRAMAILAAADGTVTVAEYSGGYGGLVVIEHTIDGQTVATAYAHSWEDGIHVSAGDQVRAGQHIADVGSSGMSTGPHLHFEVRDGGTDGEYIDPAKWLNDHDAADLDESDVPPPGQEDCEIEQGAPGDPSPVEGDPDELVDDPTTDGQITPRMRSVYEQTLAAFPESSWACYSPRPGSKSEHPIGRACDVTFGNAIGQHPTPAQLEDGWAVTNWLKDHADVLGVQYLIWQGKIWNIDRADEGWRDYDGGGMHDADSITGGHYDHAHVTVADSPGGA